MNDHRYITDLENKQCTRCHWQTELEPGSVRCLKCNTKLRALAKLINARNPKKGRITIASQYKA